jgi:indole-3-glycerol phosphate synthase
MKISGSGISNQKVIRELKVADFNGSLIGENFMKQSGPGLAIKEFVSGL